MSSMLKMQPGRPPIQVGVRKALHRLRRAPVLVSRVPWVERLEQRLVLAAAGGEAPVAPVANNLVEVGFLEVAPPPQHAVEGTAAKGPDLVAFAEALAAPGSGVTFYGAAWCPACTAQKQLFEDGDQFLPFVEVTNPDRTPNQAGIDAGVFTYPTWEFLNRPEGDQRFEGGLTLDDISALSGIDIPESSEPFVAPLDDVTLLAGSPLHLPLDGYHPSGEALHYEIRIDNATGGADITSELFEANRTAQVQVRGFGDFSIQLFDERVDRAADNFAALADLDFYDGKSIHRTRSGFVLQFGSITIDDVDPSIFTQAASPLGSYDDQFHVDAQHNAANLVSAAKGFDDTNSTDVFVTDAPTRFLDFQHSVLGIVVEGQKNRQAITDTDTIDAQSPFAPAGEQSQPSRDVQINTVEVFDDLENAFFLLRANSLAGEADVTVIVRDDFGGEFSQTFHVTIAEDTINSDPFLDDIPVIETTVDSEVTYQLTAQDVEGDVPTFLDEDFLDSAGLTVPVRAPAGLDYVVDPESGLLTITPSGGLVGTHELTVAVGVRPAAIDYQVITVQINEATTPAPAGVDLQAPFDTGAVSDDDLTRLTSLEFEVSGVTAGADVELLVDGSVAGSATAAGSSVTISVAGLSEGPHSITARQEIAGVPSDPSPALVVTVDLTAPDFTTMPPMSTPFGAEFAYDAAASGAASFRLDDGPVGMTLSPAGELRWTPGLADLGSHDVEVVAIDAAGNETPQSFTLAVVNSAPELEPIADRQVEQGATLVVTPVATDANQPGGDTLTFSLDPGFPTGATVDPTTGEIRWTPTADQVPDVYSMTLRVTDSAGAADTATFSITAQQLNVAPVLDAIDGQVVDEGEELTLTATASDDNLPFDTLTYSLAPGAPTGSTIDAASGVFRWTPAEEQGPGVHSVTVIVRDLAGEEDSVTFGVEVAEVNLPPGIDPIEDQTVESGTQVSLAVPGFDDDLPANDLAYSLEPGAPAGATIDPETGLFRWTPQFDQSGSTYPIGVRVSDGTLDALAEFRVTVVEEDLPPELEAIDSQEIEEGRTLRVTAVAEDRNTSGGALTFGLVDPPAGATIDPTSGEFHWVPGEGDGPGSYTITVEVTDSVGLRDTTTFDVEVLEVNRAPVLEEIAPKTAFAGRSLEFSVEASDPDLPAQDLTYSLEPGAPEGATIDPLTGRFRWTPPTETSGEFEITVRVADAADPALSDTGTFSVSVEDFLALAVDLSDDAFARNRVLADLAAFEVDRSSRAVLSDEVVLRLDLSTLPQFSETRTLATTRSGGELLDDDKEEEEEGGPGDGGEEHEKTKPASAKDGDEVSLRKEEEADDEDETSDGLSDAAGDEVPSAEAADEALAELAMEDAE